MQEDEETERVKYNALLDEEDEANEAKFKEKDPEKDGNDSAYASKVGNYTTVFELFNRDEFSNRVGLSHSMS